MEKQKGAEEKPFETTEEGAPKLKPTEARQGEIIFDRKRKRRRFVLAMAIGLAFYALAYLFFAPS